MKHQSLNQPSIHSLSFKKPKSRKKKKMPIFVSPMGSVSRLTSISHNFFFTEPTKLFHTHHYPSFIKRQYSSSNEIHCVNAKVSLSGDANSTELVVEEPIDDFRQAKKSADWKAAKAYSEKGYIYNARIEGSNGGGLLIRFYSLTGFLPYPQLSASHSCKEPKQAIQEIAKGLVGSLIPVKIIQVDESQRKLIVSEKEALWSKYSQQISVGDIFVGKVGSVEDYGAFIHLLFPDGFFHVTGLVHVSEVSWDLVQDVRDVLNEGDEVTVKVIKIDRAKSRITLSIKQLEEDPLFETLEKVIPQDGSTDPSSSGTAGTYNIEPLPGLETILEELIQEDGVFDVRISRQGFEKRVVSQDLQLWLSNAPPVGKQFTLLARAGRQVQEIQLTTSLDQDGIKRALQKVLERVP